MTMVTKSSSLCGDPNKDNDDETCNVAFLMCPLVYEYKNNCLLLWCLVYDAAIEACFAQRDAERDCH